MTTIDKLEVEINADSSKLTAGLNQANQSVSTFTDKITKSASTLQSFGSVGMQAMGILDRYEISTMAVQNALMTVQDAQMRYNAALSEFGTKSEQAILAQNNLERATNAYESAQLRANMSMATMGLTMVGMVPQMVKFSAMLRITFPELLAVAAVLTGVYIVYDKITGSAKTAGDSILYSGNNVNKLREEILKLNAEIGGGKEETLMEKFARTTFVYDPDTGRTVQRTPEQQAAYEKSHSSAVTAPSESSQLSDETTKQLYTPQNIFAVLNSTKGMGYSADQILKGNAQKNPSYGADRVSVNQNITIHATINKNDNVTSIFNDIGSGLARGLKTTDMKPE